MDTKKLLNSNHLLVLIVSLIFLASCAPAAPVKPWDSKFLNTIELSFQDKDADFGQIAGDVLLKLNKAPKHIKHGSIVQ
jgi:hypothetical protein